MRRTRGVLMPSPPDRRFIIVLSRISYPKYPLRAANRGLFREVAWRFGANSAPWPSAWPGGLLARPWGNQSVELAVNTGEPHAVLDLQLGCAGRFFPKCLWVAVIRLCEIPSDPIWSVRGRRAHSSFGLLQRSSRSSLYA